MLLELEENRYFVVLMAYDWPLLSKQRKTMLLWETRCSMAQRDHRFDQALAAMTNQAASFFGQDSGGLRHRSMPEGRVEVGEPKVVDPVPPKQPERPTGQGSEASPIPSSPSPLNP
jgi:hypothetical protein